MELDRGAGAGEGTEVTVIVNGFWEWLCAELTGAEVGVTVTLGVIVGFLEVDSGKRDCSLAAERPRTISSSLRRFFSLPITGSSIGWIEKEVVG